jgi:hypothetical protein
MLRMRTLRQAGLVGLFGAMTFAASAAPALASSPHFISASAAVSSTGDLVVSFKEAGLGNLGGTVQITASAQATATWGCFNGGGKHPAASNKEGPGLVSNTGTFTITNGQTTGSLTLSTTPSLSCPPGQTLKLISATYTNVSVSGAGATKQIPGIFTFP